MQVATAPDNASIERDSRWFEPGRFSLILLGAILVAFPDVMLGAKTFFFRDYAFFGYPLAQYHRDAIWRGEIPLWNPYNNCGLPFLAQWNTLTLYPLSFIYIVLPLPWSLSFFCLVHLFLAGLGMYFLARHWTGCAAGAAIAGMLFAFNGLTLSCLKWPNNIAALSLMPWVVLLVEQAWRDGGRRLPLAILLGTTQMLSGAPEIILFTWLFVGAIWVGQFALNSRARIRMFLRAAMVVLLVAGLSAIQLVPFLELLSMSQRSSQFSDSAWAMPPWGLANLLVPLFRCFESHQGVYAQFGQYWISSYYPGIVAIALMLVAIGRRCSRRVLLLMGVLVASLWLAHGSSGLLYEWVKAALPQTGLMRFPIKFVVLAVFSISLLAAYGFRNLLLAEASIRKRLDRSALLILLGLAAGIALIVAADFIFPLERANASTVWNAMGRIIALTAAVGALHVIVSRETQRKQLLGIFGLMCILVGDALLHAPRLNPTVERWVYDRDSNETDLLQFDPQPSNATSRAMITPAAEARLDHLAFTNAIEDVLYSRKALFANCNLIDSIPKVDGFFSLYFRHESEIRSLLYGTTNFLAAGVIDFLGVSQITAENKIIDWTARPTWRPFVAAGRPNFVESTNVIRALADARFDPRQEFLLPSEIRANVSSTQSQSVEVKLESVAAHRISLVTEAAAPGWITIAQSWHPSWKAIVNGVEHPIYRANHAFQAIEVPAGASRVELVYKDKAFRTGAGISIASLVLLGLLTFRNRVLTRRESTASRWITPSASSSEQTPVDWFSTGRFAIVLAGLLVVPFWKLIFGIETLFYRDFGVLAYPAIHHAKEAFWRGEIPLWNPLSNCGAPFLAQWGTMVLYPFSIFYLLLPLPWSLNVFCLAHLFLAGLGMYQLARRWTNHSFAAGLAGVVYVFNGLTFSCLLWPNYTVALGWMPWVVLLVEQAWKMGGRKTIQASIVAALQMLAGVPEISVLTWLLLAGLGLGHLLRGKVQKGRFVLRSGLIVILVSGLIAAQLLPFLELLGHSQRDASFATSKWALPIWGWANLLVPLFHCFQTPQGIFFQFGQEFFSSIYLGVVPLFFGMLAAISAASKRFWFLIACFVFAILMAMGEHGVIYSWVKELLPLAGVARYPIKFLLLGLFVLPLLAAFAFATFTNSSRSLKSKTIISLGTALLLIVGIGLILLWAANSPFPYDQWPATLKCGLGRILILLAAASCFLFCIGSRSSTIQIVARLGLLLVVVVDAFQHVPVQNPTLPRYALAPGLWEMRNKFPPPKIGEGRMMISPRAEQLLLRSGVPNLYDDWLGKRLALWSHLNLIEQTPKVNGSSTLQIREQAKVQNLLYATTNASHPRLLDFLNVTLETAPGEVIEWQRRTTALPFITAGQRPVFLPRDDILERIAAADFAPGEIVYLENGAEGIPRLTNAAPAKINSPLVGFGTVEFEIEAAAPALAVIAQSYYPAWQAFVDGQPSPLHRANYAFQCLEIPPGKHQVRLQYTDRSFRLGLAISILALLACGIGWMRSKSET